MSSLEKCLFRSFVHLLICWFFDIELYKPFIFQKFISYQSHGLQIFSSNLLLAFSFSEKSFLQSKIFIFRYALTYQFFLVWTIFLVSSLRTLPSPTSPRASPIFFPEFVDLCFAFKPVVKIVLILKESEDLDQS